MTKRGIVSVLFLLLCSLQSACATPAQIRDDIDHDLRTIKDLGAHEIEVDVKGSRVRLEGFVSSPADQEKVLSVVRATEGVSEVENNLKLQSPGIAAVAGNQEALNAIRARAKAELASKNYSLDILQRGNTVILGGIVESPNDSRAVENIARQLAPGMTVQNDIKLSQKPAISDSELTQRVLSNLKAEGISDLTGVNVETRDAIVHFTGSVRNHREIDRMLSIALMVDGVRSVRSDVKIGG